MPVSIDALVCRPSRNTQKNAPYPVGMSNVLVCGSLSNKTKTRHKRWSREEIESLILGVQHFNGSVAIWKTIFDCPSFHFHPERRANDLRIKYWHLRRKNPSLPKVMQPRTIVIDNSAMRAQPTERPISYPSVKALDITYFSPKQYSSQQVVADTNAQVPTAQLKQLMMLSKMEASAVQQLSRWGRHHSMALPSIQPCLSLSHEPLKSIVSLHSECPKTSLP